MAYHSALLRTYYGAGDYSRMSALAQAGLAFRGRTRAAPFRGGVRGRVMQMTRGAYQAGGFFSAIGKALKAVAAPALSIASSFIPGGSLLAKAIPMATKVLSGGASLSQAIHGAKKAIGIPTTGLATGIADIAARAIEPKGLAGGTGALKHALGFTTKRKRRRRTRRRAAPRRRSARRRATSYRRRGDARDEGGRWTSGYQPGPYPHRGHSHRHDVAPQYSRRRRRRGGGRRVSFRTADGRQVSFTRR